MMEDVNEAALDRYMTHQIAIREILRRIEDKLTDKVAPEDVNWGHVGWISDLHANLKEIDENW